jgi:hypothetical protein
MEGFGVVGCRLMGSRMTEGDLPSRRSVQAFYSGPG